MIDNIETLKHLLECDKGAQEAVAKASEVQSEFINQFIHEISTPINVITGVAELMEGASLSSQQMSYIKTLRNEGQKLQRLVRQLQDVLAEDYQQKHQGSGSNKELKSAKADALAGTKKHESDQRRHSMPGNPF